MMKKTTLAPILLAVLFGAMLVQLPLAIAARASDYEWFDPVIIVRTMLLEYFVEEPGTVELREMQTEVINAMVASLDDPHTEYVPADHMADFTKVMHGRYVGIGAEINVVDGYLTIVTPLDDSPAREAGVRAGDTVLEIEGESTLGMAIPEAVTRLTGEPDTDVTIRVRHTDGEEETITITRRQIVTRTVKGTHRVGDEWEYMFDPDLRLGYVRITQFNEPTVTDLRHAVDQLLLDELGGLILDLRFDPGGNLDVAVAIADLFLDRGTIVTVKGRDEEETYPARGAGTLPQFPMVVIVNELSASASEIVAGALQDNGRAKVLGERTFGKGSVQQVRALPDGLGALKLTTAYYFLPAGRNIHRKDDSLVWGVDPDDGFRVPMSDEEYNHAWEMRREFEIIRENVAADLDPEWSDPDWIRETIGDLQMAAAVNALQGKVRDGEWPTVGEAGGAEPAVVDELVRAIETRNLIVTQLDRVNERVRELQGLAAEAGREPLLPPDADLEEGELTVMDSDGNVVGRFRIVGEHLERALQTAPLQKIEE